MYIYNVHVCKCIYIYNYTYYIGHLYSNCLFVFVKNSRANLGALASGCCKDRFSGWKLRSKGLKMGISPMASMEINYKLETFFSVGDYSATAENVKKSFIFNSRVATRQRPNRWWHAEGGGSKQMHFLYFIAG